MRDIYAKDYREMSGRGRGFVARGRGVALPIPLQWGEVGVGEEGRVQHRPQRTLLPVTWELLPRSCMPHCGTATGTADAAPYRGANSRV